MKEDFGIYKKYMSKLPPGYKDKLKTVREACLDAITVAPDKINLTHAEAIKIKPEKDEGDVDGSKD